MKYTSQAKKTAFSKKLKAWHAVLNSEIRKPDRCEKCGALPDGRGGSALQAHHDDYDKPLEVKWLCKSCHMQLHRNDKKDNSTLHLKVSLRRSLLAEIEKPVVMESHGGWGEIWKRCYSHIQHGVVFEKNAQKCDALAEQRPTWAVYECDCIKAIDAGVGKHLPINFIDLDPYGEPWPVLDAYFQSPYQRPDRIAIAVNDGLRQKLKMNGGWSVESMKAKVQKYGNSAMYANYLNVCREMLEEKAAQAGYDMSRWVGYHCGDKHAMTHFGAILVKQPVNHP